MDKVVQALVTYNNHVIGDIFKKKVVDIFNKWLDGKEEGSFYNHEYYMSKYKEDSEKVVNKVLNGIEGYLLKLNKKSITKGYLYMLGVLSSGISVGYDIRTSKHYFYTKDIHLLDYLYYEGILDSDLSYLKETLSKSLLKDINNETYTCVELRLGNENIKGVIKRGLVIGDRGNIFCFPLKALLEIGFLLRNMKGVYRLKYHDGTMLKVLNVKFDSDNINMFYDNEQQSLYNIRGNCIYCHDVESPLSELGIIQVNLMSINKIEQIEENEIDKSLQNVDGAILRKWVFTRINRLKLDDLRKINIVGVQNYVNMRDKKEVLLREIEKLTTRELYYFALANTHVFGDVREGLSKAQRWVSRMFKNFDVVNLPNDNLLKLRELRRLLNNYVVRVTYIRLDGKVVISYATNNSDILKSIFGEKYILLETPNVRVESLINKFKKDNNLSKEDKLALISEYGLSSYEIDINNIEGSLIRIKQHLDKEEIEKNKQGYIVYRNVLASYRGEYFHTLHVSKVRRVEVSNLLGGEKMG